MVDTRPPRRAVSGTGQPRPPPTTGLPPLPLAPPSPGRLLGTLVALGLAAACGGQEGGGGSGPSAQGPDSTPAVPTRGGTAVVAVAAGATTLLPPLASAALDYELSGVLFPGLNHAVWGPGGLEFPMGDPLALAREWRFGPRGRSLVYRLDPSRRWSDGRPIRAADVAFTYGLLADPTLALPLSSTAERIDSVAVQDDSTVVFHFDRPYPGMLFDTGVGILPEHVYGGLPRDRLRGLPRFQESGEAELVVSGPFRLVSWRPADRIVLARNERGRPIPHLDRVVIRVIPEEAARLAELRAGGVDLAQLSSFREARKLEREPGMRILRIPQRAYDYIGWNPATHPAFGDVRVRRALSLAIDRAGMLRALEMEGYGEPAHGPYGSLFGRLVPEPPDLPSFDPERARRLLEEAGWRDDDGDGVRERDGFRLEFELATAAGNERRETAAQIIQGRLAALGVRARLRREEFGTLLDRVIRRDYEAVLLGWQVGLDPDISTFWYDPESPFNVVGYDSPEVRTLMDSARAQPTAEAADPYWRRAAARIAADYPYAFLWYLDLPVAVGPRLRGVTVDVTGFLGGMHRWWLRPGARPGQ